MRDAPTPPGNNDPFPDDRAILVRVAAAEVLLRVQEWRDSPSWTESPAEVRRYEITVNSLVSILTGEALHAAAVTATVQAVAAEWRVPRLGPTQAVYAAVERLQRTVVG
jgi:hypothetical protein